MPKSDDQIMPIVIRLKDVMKMLSVSRSMVYSLMGTGDFPKPLQLGPRAIGWIPSEISAWVESRDRITFEKGKHACL